MEIEDDFLFCTQTSKLTYFITQIQLWIFTTTYMYRYDTLGPVPAGLDGIVGP